MFAMPFSDISTWASSHHVEQTRVSLALVNAQMLPFRLLSEHKACFLPIFGKFVLCADGGPSDFDMFLHMMFCCMLKLGILKRV